MRIVFSLFLALAMAVSSGCSISNSSGSISDSISSPSESSSDSSRSSDGGDDKPAEPETPADTASYEADVSQLAVTFAKTGGEIGAFRTAVSQLAMARGITNWEIDSQTNQAIGRGVGTAGMQETSFAEFSKQLFGDDLTKQDALRTGYQETAQPETEPTPAGQSESKAS